MSHFALALVFALLALLSPGLAGLAQAQPADKIAEAKEHYEAGTRKFDVGKYEEAAAEFQAAFEAVGNPVFLFNIAQSLRWAKKSESALMFYKSYLRRRPDAPNRAEVEKRIEELTAIVESEKKAREAPPVGVLRPKEAEVPAEKGETAPAPASAKPRTEPLLTAHPLNPRQKLVLRSVGIGLAGLTAASLAVGITLSVLGNSDAKTLERAASQGAPFTPQLRDTETQGRTFNSGAIATYVLAGLFAAGSATALYFTLRPERAERSTASTTSRRTSLVLPYAAPTGAGIVYVGRF